MDPETSRLDHMGGEITEMKALLIDMHSYQQSQIRFVFTQIAETSADTMCRGGGNPRPEGDGKRLERQQVEVEMYHKLQKITTVTILM